MSEQQRASTVFTPEAFRAMQRQQALQSQIHVLVEVEHDLEWVWYESPEDLRPAVETALSAVRTTTRTFRQALGRLERGTSAGALARP